MANYETLKATIAQYIKQNGNNDITGNLLQQQLLAMINSLGVGFQFMGVATPATNPGTPDYKCFYIAITPGTYTNFSSISVPSDGIFLLVWDSAWSIKSVFRNVLPELSDGILQWISGYYYHPSTGNLTPNSSFVTTILYPAPLESLLGSMIDYTISSGYVLVTYFKNGVLAGSRNNNGYRLPDLTPAVSIDFDEFALAVLAANYPDYENRFLIPSIKDIYGPNRGYYALGDSITAGTRTSGISYSDLLASRMFFKTYVRLAVSQTTAMQYYDSPRLSAQVSQVPNDFDGVISVMIGVNDCSWGLQVGDVQTTLAKDYSSLSESANFCDAFRLNMETLKRNSPKATIVCLIPLQVRPYPGTQITEPHLEPFREAERGICKALSIPIIETNEECGITALSDPVWTDFMYDNVHPNMAGQKLITQYLFGKFREYLKF